MDTSRRPGARWRRGSLIALLVIVAVVIVVRVVADPLAARATRRALAELEDYEGDFSRVHVTFFPPGSVIERLALRARGATRGEPLLYVARADSRLVWQRLFRGELVLSQRVTGAKLRIAGPFERGSLDRLERLARRVPRILRSLPAARVDRMELADGELLLVDTARAERPRLWLHDLAATAEDLATRARLTAGQPLVATLSGRVQRTGRLASRLTIPQPAEGISFQLRTALTGLELTELHQFVAPATDLTARKGRVSTYATISARDGRISGWVRPVMDDVEVRAATPDLGDRVKAWLADKSIELFSDDRPAGGQRFAKTVPLEGRIDPDRSVVASVTEIVRATLRTALADTLRDALPGGDDEDDAPAPARGRRTGARRR